MKYYDEIEENTFEAACYDQNTFTELIDALLQGRADNTDCKIWNITPTQWRQSIASALRAKIETLQEM